MYDEIGGALLVVDSSTGPLLYYSKKEEGGVFLPLSILKHMADIAYSVLKK